MENLEKYIQDNLEQFNCGEMPLGHQERFMAKLQTAQASNAEGTTPHKVHRVFSRRSLFAATASAAAIIIAFFITTGSPATNTDEYTIAIHEVAEEMYIEEAEILMKLGEDDHNIVNSIKSITEEAIPLSEQLPAELSQEKRAQILREYYKTRTAALKNFRALAHSNEIID
ncbi:MAG: hypothetical protein E7122_09265 [Bacteroidales bacterium]|nr:hypothetical protein [Bacteroidales bacterium]